MSEVVVIAAVARNGIIGATVEGKPVLPWRLPEDLKHFKALTWGHPIIMGRKTWESLGRPLPGRRNIVVTRQTAMSAEGATVVNSLAAALEQCPEPCVFVIGGGEIYAQALAVAQRLELTEVALDADGDTTFPAWTRSDFIETARESHRAAAGFEFAFVTYQRSTPRPA